MNQIFYTQEHVWCRRESDGNWTFGLSPYAVKMLDTITYLEFYRSIGEKLVIGTPIVSVESIKVVWEVLLPWAGYLTALNLALETDPALLNREPETNGWLWQTQPMELPPAPLLDPLEYQNFLETL